MEFFDNIPKIRLDILIMLFIIAGILISHTLCACSKVGILEGFDIAKIVIGADEIIDTNKDKKHHGCYKKEGFINGNNISYEHNSSKLNDIMNGTKKIM